LSRYLRQLKAKKPDFSKKDSYKLTISANLKLIHCFRLLAAKKAEKRLKLPALRIINRENIFFFEILTRRKQTLLGKLNVIVSPEKYCSPGTDLSLLYFLTMARFVLPKMFSIVFTDDFVQDIGINKKL
jgi:hypothetical protein